MNDIEKLIGKHRAEFDSEEPQDHHFDLFRQKMQRHQSHKKNWQWKNLIKVAAVIVFIMVSAITTYQIRNIQNNHYSLGQLSPEYQEVELFYISNINHQLDTIKHLSKSSDIQDQKGLKKELDYMDRMYNQLKKELRANPKDERIIQAMIEHFQAKNNILNQVIKQLYQVNRQNSSLVEIISI